MTGDAQDMAARLRAVLPSGWFSDTAPILNAVLLGLGTAWSAIYDLVAFVRLQTRIATSVGNFLDAAAADFFGFSLVRRNQETDVHFLVRIRQEMLRQRATRAALSEALTDLTGRTPVIFEPARTADTGGYAVGGVGYGVAGGWGNLQLPYQVFVTAFRPAGAGIAAFAGYGTGGYLYYGSQAMIAAPVPDAAIYAEIAALVPAATIAWSRIADPGGAPV